jgi:hypothetical protein
VPDAESQTRIRDAISDVAGVARVNGGLDVRPPPFCTVLAALPSTDGAAAPTLRLNHTDGLYHEGERITVTVTARGEAARHVYVSYLDSEGTLLHLLPSADYPGNELAPGERLQLGRGEGQTEGVTYRAAAPHGLNMILAVSSTRALFETREAAPDTPERYVAALNEAMARVADAGGRVDVATRFLRTER